MAVLKDNVEYLVNTLQLDGVSVACSDEANKKTQEECMPGAPFIVFRIDPSIEMNLINDQPHTGMFVGVLNRQAVFYN